MRPEGIGLQETIQTERRHRIPPRNQEGIGLQRQIECNVKENETVIQEKEARLAGKRLFPRKRKPCG